MDRPFFKTASFKLGVSSENRLYLDRALAETTAMKKDLFSRIYPFVRRIANIRESAMSLVEKKDAEKIARVRIAKCTSSLYKENKSLPSGIKDGWRTEVDMTIESYLALLEKEQGTTKRTTKYPFTNSARGRGADYERASFCLPKSDKYGFLLLRTPNDDVVLYLNLFAASDKREEFISLIGYTPIAGVRPNRRKQGQMCTIGVPPKSRVGILCSLQYSHLYQNKRFIERGIPKSVTVIKRKDDYYAQIAFEFRAAKKRVETNFTGIDLGIARLAAFVTVNNKCERLGEGYVDGQQLRQYQKQKRQNRALRQKQGHVVRGHRLKNFSDHVVNKAAVSIIGHLLEMNARPVWENLDHLKNGAHHKRQKYKRRSAWNRLLNNAQYGKLQNETMRRVMENGFIHTKLLDVLANYTSQMCSSCGYCDKNNRPTQSEFCCGRCGHTENADINAAHNIAAKGLFLLEMWEKNHQTGAQNKVCWPDFPQWYIKKIALRQTLTSSSA